ncbi:MAG: LacI family DNA-binding transcriptional regulator [Cellulosilyticaceae bacterium]
MAKLIKMSDIAKELNISTVTVSKALGDREGVSEVLREEIKRKAMEMGYVYNKNSSADQEHNAYATRNIGILVSERFMDANNSFYWSVYQMLIKYLVQYNYSGILEVISLESEKKGELPNVIVQNKVDGIILLGQAKGKYIDLVNKQPVPFLLMDFYDNHVDVDIVIGDNVYGGYTITNYLINQGHTRIGFVGNIYATSSILDRYLGYYKALIENHLEVEKEWLVNDRDEEGRYRDFILPDQMPTAFVCNCDQVAYYFIQQLNQKGFKVPEDISIVAFDNFIYASLSKPKITTIEVNIGQMAKEAVKVMIDKIKHGSTRVERKVISGNMVMGDSVRYIK